MSSTCDNATSVDEEDRKRVATTGGSRGRRTSNRFGFIVAAASLLILFAQVGAPSPLFPIYQDEWALTPLMVTAVFAAYVLGLLVTLTTMGSLSDHIGRRPVVLIAAAVAIIAIFFFVSATNAVFLLIARVLQGASIGIGSGALGAALIDFQPASRPHLAATLTGTLPPLSLAVGAITSGILVQYAPGPTVTVFVVFGILTLVVAALLFFVVDRNEPRPGALASLKPSIALPLEVRRVFFAVAGCIVAAWSLGGLYMGLGPTIIRSLLHLDSALAAGLAIVAVTGTGALTGFVIQKRDALISMVVGAIALIVGPALTAAALLTSSVWGFYGSSVVVGIGFGAAFQGGLRLILAVAPVEGRAGLLSSVYLVSYAAFGVPSIVAGILVPHFGLLLVALGYAAFVALLAAVALALQLIMNRKDGVEQYADDEDARLT